MPISQLICQHGNVIEEVRWGRSASLKAAARAASLKSSGPVVRAVPTSFTSADYQAARAALESGVKGVTVETLATIARGLPEPPDGWGKRGVTAISAAKADKRTGHDLVHNPPNPWARR